MIAMELGSTSEVIADGKTGFLCHSVEECIDALSKVPGLNRQDCRQHVEDNFSVRRMVDGYEAVYQQVLAERFAQNGRALAGKLR